MRTAKDLRALAQKILGYSTDQFARELADCAMEFADKFETQGRMLHKVAVENEKLNKELKQPDDWAITGAQT